MSASTSPLSASPARATVVLLHSSGSSSRQWDALADALCATHDVRAIDLHGHGSGPAWTAKRPLSVHDDAALALPVLEAAGGGHVIGHSYGGAVAVHLAARHPRWVRSLAVYEPVLLNLLADPASGHAGDPAHPGLTELIAVAERMRRQLHDGDIEAASRDFVDYWSGAGTWQAMGPARQRGVAQRAGVIAAHFATLRGEPLPAATAARLTMPTLVLHGTETTQAARALARLLRRWLPQAEHRGLAGLGHMGPLTHAASVNAELLRFLGADAPWREQPAEALSA